MSDATLIINNDYSIVKTNDQELIKFIYNKMRWREKNYWHKTAFKKKLWDGYRNFFSEKTGKFLTGLLPEVKVLLKFKNINYKIQDNRNFFNWKHSSIDENFLNQWLNIYNNNVKEEDRNADFTLRDYQPELVNGILKHYRGTVQAPTSSGKTAVMVSILKCLPADAPALILVGTQDLCEQNYQEIKAWGIPNVGRLYAGHKDPNVITCSTWQSAPSIENLLPKFKCLIVDEIHEMMADNARWVYQKMKKAVARVAISATPFKDQDKVHKFRVKGFFGPIIKIESAKGGVLTTKELQDRGFLPPSNCIVYPIRHPDLSYKIYQDAVTEGIANNFHFHEVVSRLAKQQKGRTLILVERIDQGDYLHDLIPDSLWVRGKDSMKTRKFVINELKHSSHVVGIATRHIFNTGINVYVNNLINAAGGKAEHIVIQKMGRGLRTAKDKPVLNYYDFMFYINEYLKSHSDIRVGILTKEGHKVIVKEEIDF